MFDESNMNAHDRTGRDTEDSPAFVLPSAQHVLKRKDGRRRKEARRHTWTGGLVPLTAQTLSILLIGDYDIAMQRTKTQ